MEFIKVKLSDIGEVVGGSTPSTKNPDNYDGNIAWITPKDLAGYNKVYISRGERNITEAGFKSCSTKMLPKNSVLFSSRAPIGYVAISENDLCTNQGFKSIIPNEKVDYKFLYYLLKHNKDYIASKGSGSTFKEVSGSVMKGIELSIPKDINDQRKISKVLFDIDKKIELNNEINNNLYELGISIFNNMYDDNDTISIKFGDIVTLLRDGTHNPPKRVEKGVPLLTGQTINNGFIEYDKMTYVSSDDYKKIHAKYEPKENDLVLTKIGTVGKVGILRRQDIPMCIHCNSALIRFDEKYLDQFTGFWFLNSNYFQIEFNKAITNTVQDFVSLGAMSNLEIKIPNINIVNVNKELLKNTLLKMSELNNENSKLTNMRDTLLPKLMNGEIDLNNIEI